MTNMLTNNNINANNNNNTNNNNNNKNMTNNFNNINTFNKLSLSEEILLTSLPDTKERVVIFDTETTGLNYVTDHIISIAAIEVVNKRFTGVQFQGYIKPRVFISDDAIKIHKLDNSFYNDYFHQTYFNDYDVMSRFRKFVGSSLIFAHNAPFDYHFVTKEFRYFNIPIIEKDNFRCTMRLFKKIFSEIDSTLIGNTKLSTCCKYANIEGLESNYHSALFDSFMTARLLIFMWEFRDKNASSKLKKEIKNISVVNHINSNVNNINNVINTNSSNISNINNINVNGNVNSFTGNSFIGVKRQSNSNYFNNNIIDNSKYSDGSIKKLSNNSDSSVNHINNIEKYLNENAIFEETDKPNNNRADTEACNNNINNNDNKLDLKEQSKRINTVYDKNKKSDDYLKFNNMYNSSTRENSDNIKSSNKISKDLLKAYKEEERNDIYFIKEYLDTYYTKFGTSQVDFTDKNDAYDYSNSILTELFDQEKEEIKYQHIIDRLEIEGALIHDIHEYLEAFQSDYAGENAFCIENIESNEIDENDINNIINSQMNNNNNGDNGENEGYDMELENDSAINAIINSEIINPSKKESECLSKINSNQVYDNDNLEKININSNSASSSNSKNSIANQVYLTANNAVKNQVNSNKITSKHNNIINSENDNIDIDIEITEIESNKSYSITK